MTAPRYATTLQLASSLKMVGKVPSRANVGDALPAIESLGSATVVPVYTAYPNIISGSYTISYGASASATQTDLTETTDYTIDLTEGAITLTSGGISKVGANTVFAKTYKYVTRDISDSELNDVLLRAENQVEDVLKTRFTDGTATNPDYIWKTDILDTEGIYNQQYYTTQRPVIDIASTLASDITASQTTLTLATGDGKMFPISGTIAIETEKITYTGVSTDSLTGLTRGVGNSTAAAHVAGKRVNTTVVEMSGDFEGSEPTFFVMQNGLMSNIDQTPGQVFIYDSWLPLSGLYSLSNQGVLPKQDVPNRLKITYIPGYNTIPVSITRLAIIFAKRMLAADTISASIFKGANEFDPAARTADQDEVDRTVAQYAVPPMGNT